MPAHRPLKKCGQMQKLDGVSHELEKLTPGQQLFFLAIKQHKKQEHYSPEKEHMAELQHSLLKTDIFFVN